MVERNKWEFTVFVVNTSIWSLFGSLFAHKVINLCNDFIKRAGMFPFFHIPVTL